MNEQTSALHPRSLLTPMNPAAAVVGEKPNYPFNHWWIIAKSDEVTGDAILSRTVLGMDVALFRRKDGTLAAIEDRCAHRGVPLSLGTLVDEQIVCRYHGFRYAADGTCVHIPTQQKIPAKTAVRSFPIKENAPFIWIWTGDPAKAANTPAPDQPFLRAADWVHGGGYLHIDCNYMALKENVLDLTHFPFLHSKTFEMADDYCVPPRCTFENGIVSFHQEFLDQALPPHYAIAAKLGDKRVDRFDVGSSLSPAEHEFTARIVNKSPGPGEKPEYFVKYLHLTTPETRTSMHYWWIMARDHGLGPEASRWMTDVNAAGFLEDKDILEAMQRRVNSAAQRGDVPEVSVLADQAGLQTRRQLQAILDKDG